MFSGIAFTRIEEFQKRIIKWYSEHGDRDIPWRNTGNPWLVLIAAILLKKTTTLQVLKIYRKFAEKYPDPRTVLGASEDEIVELIKPLGMEYRRAELLVRLADSIVRRFGGLVPCERSALEELPGVGDYTASEVLLVACNKPEPLLDRNMIRVIGRVFGVSSPKKRPHTDKMLWEFARALVPKDPADAKAFNYGVLDLARKVCTARKPKCRLCPIREICSYYGGDGKA